MPKSRRAKVVPLTKTKPKGRDHKSDLMELVRDSMDKYTDVYAFTVHNMRTNILQAAREERRNDSRLFMGNNKVMMIALGKDEETSAKPNLHKLTKFLTGLSGLLFTNMPKKEVKEYWGALGGQVYARAGVEATTDFSLPAGPMPQFPHSMYDQLTKLGLPVKLDKGTIVLTNDVVVCKEGDELTSEAAQLLRLFNIQSAEFKFELTAHWCNGVARKVTA